MAAVVLVVMNPPWSANNDGKPVKGVHAARKLPAYWTVHPGDTLTQIAHSTGLSVTQLEARNPEIDPRILVPGERLLLWRHPPRHRRKPPGPRFWKVKPGESFGSIAAKTGISITKLFELNRQLKPASLQPGDRVRLRR